MIAKSAMIDRFHSFRKGYIDAVACHPIDPNPLSQIWYDLGWKEGRETFRARLAAIRQELGLPPENMVRAV